MRPSLKSGFLLKAVGAFALVVLGDHLFWERGFGSNLGVFALAWTVGTIALVPAVRRDGRSLVALAVALMLGLVLGNDPGWLALVLFWSALAIAALLPRVARFGTATQWLYRLAIHGVSSVIGPWRDLARVRRQRRRGDGAALRGLLPLLPLPLIGGAVFLGLFAAANPLIGDALDRLSLTGFEFFTIIRLLFAGAVLTTVWATLRPHRNVLRLPLAVDEPGFRLPGVSVGSVTLSLVAFNALFALQNGLDIAFLWSGAALPDGMTLAGYAHRGAYPLIATALLAGLFVLVTLRPGSDTARVPLIRRMVVLWVAQNVFLVASSILRTLDYIDAYSLTRLRIAALAWMALVAVGLLLILWRMLAARSTAWLINANAAAAGAVLLAASAVDLGSVAAGWNVRHAREVGGHGAALDLCYLGALGPSSLVSLTELQARPGLAPAFALRVGRIQNSILNTTGWRQVGGSWTWRNARRLAQVEAITGHRHSVADGPQSYDIEHNCDGSMIEPTLPVLEAMPPPPVPAPSPPPRALTPGSAR